MEKNAEKALIHKEKLVCGGKKVREFSVIQNMDPWSMDPLHGLGPWTGSMKIWTGSMDPFHGPGPWTPYFYYP